MVACAELADADLPDGVVCDGRNPLPLLTDGAKSPHDSFYFKFRKHAAVRRGDWKIVRSDPEQPWQLFNLANDRAETLNLATQHSSTVQDLVATFADWERSF
jgi:arylsulfatase A-like enzyme